MATMTNERRWEQAGDLSDDDAALVLAAQRDPAAFAPLYAKYFDGIFAYAYRMLRDSDLAADATSQTFARALQGLNAYRSRSFRGWLFSIAHNVIVDHFRRSKPSAPLGAADEIVDRALSPETQALHLESEEYVDQMLGRLTGDQRVVVELRLAGLRGREIAEALGVSLSAVKALQFRAYTKLRTLIASENQDAAS